MYINSKSKSFVTSTVQAEETGMLAQNPPTIHKPFMPNQSLFIWRDILVTGLLHSPVVSIRVTYAPHKFLHTHPSPSFPPPSPLRAQLLIPHLLILQTLPANYNHIPMAV